MADSIKLFNFSQKCQQFIGVFPSQSNQKYLSTNFIRAISLICMTQFLFQTGAFFLFEPKSMFDYGWSLTVVIYIITCIVVYLIFIWQSEKTLKFIENCEGFIEKRVHSVAAYEQLIGKIELFNQLYCIAFDISVAFLFISPAPYSYVRYFIFNMEENSYFLFCPSLYPFDWKTPGGYLVAWLLQCAGIAPVSIVASQFLNSLIGSGWLFIFIAEDITQDVAGFNLIATTTTDNSRTELTKRFCDIVQIFSDAKQCVMELSKQFEYTLFSFFAFGLLSVAGMLVALQFQFWDDNANSFETGIIFYTLLWTIVYVFILCEPGARMTNQFEMFSDEVSQCDWYSLSAEMQRMYLIFLSDTQNPIEMTSFGNIACERETLKRIFYKAYSYFSTFRNFEP